MSNYKRVKLSKLDEGDEFYLAHPDKHDTSQVWRVYTHYENGSTNCRHGQPGDNFLVQNIDSTNTVYIDNGPSKLELKIGCREYILSPSEENEVSIGGDGVEPALIPIDLLKQKLQTALDWLEEVEDE